jgi:hypothetical protein
MPRDLTSVAVERALEREGCALCRLAQEHERRWLWLLLWEQVTDPEIRERIGAAWGFCRRHAWTLAYLERREFGGSLGTSIIYEDLTGRVLERCGEATPGNGLRQRARRGRRPDLSRVLPGQKCLTCGALEAEGRDKIAWFARSAPEAWFVEVYRRADGLCIDHLYRVLTRASAEARAFLVDVQATRFAAVSHEPCPNGDLSLLAGPGSPHLLPASRLAPEGGYGLPGTPRAEHDTPGCSSCTAEAEAEAGELRRILAATGAPEDDPGGVCAEHVVRLQQTAMLSGRADQVAAWAARRARGASADLAALAGASTVRGLARLAAWGVGRRPAATPRAAACTVCAAMATAGRAPGLALAQSDPRATAQTASAGDWCLRHLGAAWPALSPAAARSVGARLRVRLADLRVGLREYVRKSDWNQRHEPRGAEQSAWLCAIGLFVGAEWGLPVGEGQRA